jgi:predicted amidohydrolase
MGQAAASEADVVVLPELWNTSYAGERLASLADSHGRETMRFLGELARQYRVNIVGGSIAELRDGRIFNVCYVFDRAGYVVARYAKVHLFQGMDEKRWFAAGEAMPTFSLDGICCGVMICYDLRFPEVARRLAVAGAEIIFMPAQWPNPRLHHWRTLVQARAIEDQVAVVACNRTGVEGTNSFFGHSMVADPWGQIIGEAGDTEQVLCSDVDVQDVRRVREMFPVLSDLAPFLRGEERGVGSGAESDCSSF